MKYYVYKILIFKPIGRNVGTLFVNLYTGVNNVLALPVDQFLLMDNKAHQPLGYMGHKDQLHHQL